MTLYQRKNSTVQAIQWTVDNYQDVIEFTNGNVALTADNLCVIINGLAICENDWILKFQGKETSVGPVVTRFSMVTNSVFQEEYELFATGYEA